MKRKRKFLVELEVPRGVPLGEMEAYIEHAIKRWVGHKDPNSPIFQLNLATVKVKTIKESKRPKSSFGNTFDVDINLIDVRPEHKEPSQRVLDDFVSSIKDEGVICPITIERAKGGRFKLFDGLKRLRACIALKKEKVLCQIINLEGEFIKYENVDGTFTTVVPPIKESIS